MALAALAFFMVLAGAAAALHYRLDGEGRPSVFYVSLLITAAPAGAFVGFVVAAVGCFWCFGGLGSGDEENEWSTWIMGVATWLGAIFAASPVFWHSWHTSPNRIRDRRLNAADYEDVMSKSPSNRLPDPNP